jgi:hypothetical protein
MTSVKVRGHFTLQYIDESPTSFFFPQDIPFVHSDDAEWFLFLGIRRLNSDFVV